METYGGQAVMEGVMMRSKDRYAIAVRKENGKIVIIKEKLRKKKKFLNHIFIRGIVSLIEILFLGIKGIIWSTNQQTEDDDEITFKEVIVMLIMSIGFVILFFTVVPFFVTRVFITNKGIYFNLIEGLIRILVFVVYVLLISLMKDVKTLFQYHGAEHKVVHCYEKEKKISVSDSVKYSTLHKRCGTSFILIVFIVSVLFFSIVEFDSWYSRLILRILLIPVIASVSYEIIKLGDKYKYFSFLSYPGILMQKITTKEPTTEQIEVAIAALKAVI